MLRNKRGNIGQTAVASNNQITVIKYQNIFDKAATVEGLETKLNSQRSSITHNNALLAMFTAQVDLCRGCCSYWTQRTRISSSLWF